MLFSLMLLGLLAQAPQVEPVVTFDAAVALAADGRDAEALAAFQRLVSTSPDDHQSRIWIGRLHQRMGNPDLAEPVFRSIALEDGGNIDARLGSGTALIALDRYEEAVDTLEAAAELAPQNAEVLAALGRAHTLAGNRRAAVLAFAGAYTVAPTAANRLAWERARLAAGHRVDVQYAREDFAGSIPLGHIANVAADFGAGDSLRLFARAHYSDKFDVIEKRGGGGLAWTPNGMTTLTLQALGGPDAVVIPVGDYLADVSHAYRGVTGAMGVRYYDFAGANMTVISPSLEWQALEALWVGVRYGLSRTDTPAAIDTDAGHTVHGRVEYALRPRIRLLLGVARGVDDFDNLTIDRVGNFTATTGAAGVRVDLRTLTSVAVRYEHQRPHAGPRMNRVTIKIMQGI